MSDEETAARLTALRAEVARAGGPFVVVGIIAVLIAEIVVVALFAGRATTPWLWVHAAAMATVLAAAAAMLFAQQLVQPDDTALVGRWLPLARRIGFCFDIVVLAGPWVLLPLARPLETVVIYLIYAWFLGMAAMFNSDDEADARRSLIGLPVSLSLYLLVHDAPLALPLTVVFCAAGGTLAYYERALRLRQTDAYLDRIAGERAAADLLARLNALAPPVAVAEQPEPAGRLTPRQFEVLRHVADGRSNKEIARALNISPATVKVHVAQILATTGAGNRTAAAVGLLRAG